MFLHLRSLHVLKVGFHWQLFVFANLKVITLNSWLLLFHFHQDLVYDLGDASKWEFMFSTTDKPLLMIPSVDETDPLDIDDEEVYINSMTDQAQMSV